MNKRSKEYKKKCCVPGCMDTTSTQFRFPSPRTYLDMFQKWLKVIKSEKLKDKTPDTIYANCRVCARHFEQQQLVAVGNRGVKRTAIPRLFLPVQDVCQPSTLEEIVTSNEHQVGNPLLKNVDIDLKQLKIVSNTCTTTGRVTIITPKNTEECIKLEVFSDDSEDIEISNINSNTQLISSNNYQEVFHKEQPALEPSAGTSLDIDLQVSEANIANTNDQTESSNLDITEKSTTNNSKNVIGFLVQKTTLPNGKQMGVLQILDGLTPNFDLATEMNKLLDSDDDLIDIPTNKLPMNKLPMNKLSIRGECSKCNKLLNGDFAMKCAGCSKEFHNTCVNISKHYFHALNNIDGLKWFCMRCR